MYDLHTHSYYSDGQLSPADLVGLARDKGVTTLALTDHDTVDGVQEAQRAAGDDLTVIAGVEFSALWKYGQFGQSKGIHIVGLNVDLCSSELKSAIAHQTAVREKRAKTIAEKLEKVGIADAWHGAAAYAKGNIIGRPHFAQYLVDQGYVNNFAAAFKKYLGAGRAGDVKQCWPEIETVVQWIKNAGGVSVLAHPAKYDLTRSKLYELVNCFKGAGGQAIEVVSGKQEKTKTDQLLRVAQDFSLLASCGSDFHAPDQPWQSLGEYSTMPDGCKPVWHAF